MSRSIPFVQARSAADVARLRREVGDGADHDGASQSGAHAIPLLQARPGGIASALAAPLRARSPVLAFCLVTLLGYLVLLAAAIATGFLLVDVLLPFHAIGHSDERVDVWLAAHRSSSLNRASRIGSDIGDVPFLPIVVTVVVAAAAVLRRWRVLAFVLGAILVEVATYRVTSLIVHRHRPTVLRLDHLPVNQSYPSGHVAASVAVYIGIALLVSSRVRSTRIVIAVWAVAILLPLVVATSRMYRGMHHPTDVMAGALIGLGSIVVALVATRTAGEVSAPHRHGEQ